MCAKLRTLSFFECLLSQCAQFPGRYRRPTRKRFWDSGNFYEAGGNNDDQNHQQHSRKDSDRPSGRIRQTGFLHHRRRLMSGIDMLRSNAIPRLHSGHHPRAEEKERRLPRLSGQRGQQARQRLIQQKTAVSNGHASRAARNAPSAIRRSWRDHPHPDEKSGKTADRSRTFRKDSEPDRAPAFLHFQSIAQSGQLIQADARFRRRPLKLFSAVPHRQPPVRQNKTSAGGTIQIFPDRDPSRDPP